jgi:hypothetical protein
MAIDAVRSAEDEFVQRQRWRFVGAGRERRDDANG